jgi:hypothetical protein
VDVCYNSVQPTLLPLKLVPVSFVARWKWAVENEIKINPGKSKAVGLTKASVEERIRYYFRDQLTPEVSSYKHLGIIIIIIIRSDL